MMLRLNLCIILVILIKLSIRCIPPALVLGLADVAVALAAAQQQQLPQPSDLLICRPQISSLGFSFSHCCCCCCAFHTSAIFSQPLHTVLNIRSVSASVSTHAATTAAVVVYRAYAPSADARKQQNELSTETSLSYNCSHSSKGSQCILLSTSILLPTSLNCICYGCGKLMQVLCIEFTYFECRIWLNLSLNRSIIQDVRGMKSMKSIRYKVQGIRYKV